LPRNDNQQPLKKGKYKVNNSKITIVTGITGQNGGYLAKLLLSKGYEIVGAYHHSATDSLEN
jgi:GDP-D-mannose dehydratase